jgi:hypothetical protein
MTLFLEPVARVAARVSAQASLEKSQQEFLWRPHLDEMPFPWHLPQENIWVETYPVFIKDKLIIRELSKKEQAQIIDLHTDWAEDLVEEFWKCNHGQAPPLRLLCEIGIVGAAWLNYTSSSMENEQQDWQTNIPSWLGFPGDRLGENKSSERLDYFGWVGFGNQNPSMK